MPASSAGIVARMQDVIHEVLAPEFGGARSFALFDFPDHNNVGDSAIWLGELEYLRKRHGATPVYVCRADHADVARLSDRFSDALLLLHGGGNFGDLWRWHHDRRESLLEQFKGRHIIQMPQTIKFESQESLERTARIIKEHGNFTLLVRDQRSYDLAVSSFECRVHLCPDMAFYIGNLKPTRRARHDLLLLIRDDHERAEGVAREFDFGKRPGVVVDWQSDARPMRAAKKLLALVKTVIRSPFALRDPYILSNAYFRQLARDRVASGLDILSSGRFVITDRLHAYILALLLDIPRSVIDNSYGKISGFIDAWMRDEDRIPTHRTAAEAVDAFGASGAP